MQTIISIVSLMAIKQRCGTINTGTVSTQLTTVTVEVYRLGASLLTLHYERGGQINHLLSLITRLTKLYLIC